MLTTASDSYINKLRIVGEVEDSMAFQLRLQALLSSTDFSTPGVSPAAIVCIRSLSDPRPGTLRLVRSELEGAGAWSEALNQSVAGKINRAARPANGFVPGNAECILFADRAELLACLARDWLGGSLWAHWWWKILLRTADSAEIVKQLWRDHPQYAPAALDRLAREHQAASFVKALTGEECNELLRNIVRSFAIHELEKVCTVSLPFDRLDPIEVSTGTRARAEIEPRAFAQKSFTAPWERWVDDELTSEVSSEQQRLLGIALTIARAPAYARSREFARAVEHWQSEIKNRIQSPETNLPPSSQVHDELTPSLIAQIQSVESEVDQTIAASRSIPESAGAEYQERQLARESDSRRQIETPPATSPFRDSDTLPETPRRRALAGDDKSIELIIEPGQDLVSDKPSAPVEPFIAAQESVSPITDDAVVDAAWLETETQLGGFFYLINLALYLNLYHDFTMPTAPEIELNIWDFVALVGRDLTGDEDAEDPIWKWLAEMSGRAEDQNAEPLAAPEWLSTLMPDIRARLRAALGSESDEDAAGTLCRHYARVRATDTHVDVFFGLADLPLEIRFAGLDRDPGWVPAAGRFIAFHFD